MNTEYNLRDAAATIAEQYYTPATPEIKTILPFIAWLEETLDGISFSTDWDPNQSGDYDPTRPAHFLDSMYKTFDIKGFTEQARSIKKEIESPTLTPSKALSILRKNWKFYNTFPTMNRCIEYCIYCAAEFPDNSDVREEFCHAIRQIQLPQHKDSQRESEEA